MHLAWQKQSERKSIGKCGDMESVYAEIYVACKKEKRKSIYYNSIKQIKTYRLMKYVKIFDSQMRPLGVLQLGAELAQSEETKYVKVYDENLDKCNGVVALSDNISETDAAKRIKIYDANLILIGGSTVGEIIDNRVTPDLSITAKDTTLGKDVTVRVTGPDDLTGSIELYINGELIETQNPVNGRVSFIISNLDVGTYEPHAYYEGNEKYLPADVYKTFVVTGE